MRSIESRVEKLEAPRTAPMILLRLPEYTDEVWAERIADAKRSGRPVVAISFASDFGFGKGVRS